MFVSPSYTAVIDETLAAGGQIGVTVSATDLDNHNITYSIATTTDGSFFSVDARSGVVTLAHLVDYEDPLERTLTFTVSSAMTCFPSPLPWQPNFTTQ